MDLAVSEVAALYVLPDGPYAGVECVHVWDESRDAREYRGPWPVVAHPPCARWGRYWYGGPSVRQRRRRGDDGGCFESAVRAVRQFGGVLEHPEASSAWIAHQIARPPRGGGWVSAGFFAPGWTCRERATASESERHRQRLSTREGMETPQEFRDVLLAIARAAVGGAS